MFRERVSGIGCLRYECNVTGIRQEVYGVCDSCQTVTLLLTNSFQVCWSSSVSSMSKISATESWISLQRSVSKVSKSMSGVVGWLVQYKGTLGSYEFLWCQLSKCHIIELDINTVPALGDTFRVGGVEILSLINILSPSYKADEKVFC